MFKKIKELLSSDSFLGSIIFGLMIVTTIGCIGYAVYEEYTNPGSTTTTASAPMKTRVNGGFGYGF